MEVIVLVWVLVMATLWLVRMLAEEAWAAIRGQTSPRIERRRSRERLAAECGKPTIGQAVAFRVADRIAHPPQRRWAVKLRGLLDEMWDDALTEARVRHQHAHEARMRAAQKRRAARPRPPRGRGWEARTGSDAPPPPAEDVIDTWPCQGCDGYRQVLDPDELCDTCQAEPDPYPWPPPDDAATDEPPASPPDNIDQPDLRKAPTMPTATFTISGDVRDPRTALNAAETMRGANNAIADEMDTLLNNMRLAELGQGMLDAIASLADEQRSYADSNAEQCRVYAGQVLAQQDIYDDDDLRDTVRDTYLDMQGGDLVTPPAAVPGSVAISAIDCRTPEAGSWFMGQVALAYEGMRVSIDQMKGNHEQQQAPAESIEFLGNQLGFAASIATHAAALRDRFQAHVAKLADTLDPNDLRRSQDGKYAQAGA
jgi:hypothetical protein